jgi:hypothetical protein
MGTEYTIDAGMVQINGGEFQVASQHRPAGDRLRAENCSVTPPPQALGWDEAET